MKIVISTIFIALLASCQNNSEKKFDKLDKLNWLIGNWEQKLPDGILVENWTKDNDSTFSGKSYFINKKDTVHFENINLHQDLELLTYTSTVVGQNNDKPVDFKLISDADNTFVFDNPIHDYPQKITYKKVTETNLIATISGKQQGKLTQESYPMAKK